MSDYYAVLGVSQHASDDEIKKRTASSPCNSTPTAITGRKRRKRNSRPSPKRHDALRDPDRRAMYDRYGEAGLRSGASGAPHVDLADALNIFMRDFGGFGGLGDLLGGRGQGRSGGDIKLVAELTLLDVAHGLEKSFPVKLLNVCDACQGSGAEPGSRQSRCPTCAGSGEVRRAQRSFFGQFVSVAPCPTCAGQGTVVEMPCKKCRGDGRSRVERTIHVRIPAGVATGQYMTLRGQGNVGSRGGVRGDIVVVFQVADDPAFRARRGRSVHRSVALLHATGFRHRAKGPGGDRLGHRAGAGGNAERTCVRPPRAGIASSECIRHRRSARSGAALDSG